MRELWRSIGLTSGARIYAVVASALTLTISARLLGPEGRGAVAASVTWALLFATVGYLSLGQVALHSGTGKPANEWLGPVLAALMAMTVAVSAVSWVVAGVIYVISDGHAYGEVPLYALALGFAAVPLLVWEQYGSWLLIAVGRISVYNRAEVVGRTIGVVLIVLLVGVATFGVAGVLVTVLIAQSVVAATGFRYLLRVAGRSLALDRTVVRELLVGGAKLHLNAVGTFLFANAAVLVVQLVRGPAETGAFQVVIQLMTVALLIPQAASMVLYGEVARDGPDRAWAVNRRVLLALSGLMVLVVGAGFLLAPVVVPLLFGSEFDSAVPVFQILIFGLIGQTFSAVMAPQWIGRGLFWQASALTVALGICNVIACIVLVNAYGMKGAAFSLLGVSTVSIVGNGIMALWVNGRPGVKALSR